MGVVLGIDFGEKRVGVAVSDPDGLLAFPLALLDGSEERALLDAIRSLVSERAAERVVVGLPRLLDGSVGEMARRAERFAGLLRDVLPVPVETWDERLTSAQAERVLRVADGREGEKGNRPRRRAAGRRPAESKEAKGRIDRVAAALILQSYLDRRRSGRPEEE
ncbi:MAG: Holliday junction resolvase RuvX [Candidatus Eisenbacteria bacterium]